MKDNERSAVIYVATDEKQLCIPFPIGGTVEDLCIKICKQLGISPVARHLFALRSYSSKLWLPYGHKLDGKEKNKFDFRLRFKPSSVQRLKQIDALAYNYYFMQARADILDNKVPDIVYEKHKRELIGLGVSDMYRVILEKQLPKETVESDYKKYIPKECIKRHAFFIKKPIRNALEICAGSLHDASYVKEQYLKQFECMAPNYLYEEYKALMDKGVPNPPAKVLLRVNLEEVKYCETDIGAWKTLCVIEELCYISIRQDNTVEISRKNGIPLYLKFSANAMLMSFVSALDGYYRLSIKWTFNLCRDVITPTLERLHKLKCHGPVGEEFSYTKLTEKRAKRPGTYILRESETEYDVYYIDVCGKDGKILSKRIEHIEPNKFLIVDTQQICESLWNLTSSFQDPTNLTYLEECLPPSEYDISPLLICASEKIVNEVAADEKIIATLLESGPRCVPRDQLQVYETKSEESLIRIAPTTTFHRAKWRVAKGKKLDVAMKILKTEENKFAKEFLELAGKWGQLRSGALVRLYGVTVAPTIGMLLELVSLGPLDKYLRDTSSDDIQTADLVEATACLATALWHLEENHVVHGNIRCKRLFVHEHTENSFIVKLGDPGLFIYTSADIPWIPPECYTNLSSAKSSLQADIWALATTTWEIFSRGKSPLMFLNTDAIMKFYQSGQRLSAPKECPDEIYKLMLECWGEHSLSTLRKQPQAIMRDINQIMYQVYKPRRTHAYAAAFPKYFNANGRDTGRDDESTDREETKSISESQKSSLNTDITSLPYDDGDVDDVTRHLVNSGENCFDSWNSSSQIDSYTARTPGGSSNYPTRGDSFNNGHVTDNSSVGSNSNNSFACQIQNVFELDADCEVLLQGRIGQGFYGDVYRGTLMKHNGTQEEVAIKKLKTGALEANLRDFEREITIMKALQHDNIVKILGAVLDPEAFLVMEFVKYGSLQSYLRTHKKSLTHNRLLSFSLDIATGMEYLGHKNIVHRDLAARNILVADENQVKISDFGLAQVIGNDDYYILRTNRDLPIKWYAPESLSNGKFSSRSDVWSFGVTMYETFSLGEDPTLNLRKDSEIQSNRNDIEEEGSAQSLLTALERGIRLPCPPTCPMEVYTKLMLPCWNIQSKERPNFATLRTVIRELLTLF